MILSMLAGLLLLTGQVYASGGHPQGDATLAAPCSNPAEPASLACGLAPSSAFDSQGRLWVTWAHAGHVYVTNSADQGKRFRAPTVVNRIPEKVSASGQQRPKIVVSANGDVYVAWTLSLEKRFTGHIRFSRSEDDGAHFSTPINVNDNQETISHRFEAMAVDPQGTIFLSWLDKRDQQQASKTGKEYAGAALYYTWSEDRGRHFQTNQKIMDNSCECCRVIMNIDHDGLPAILWRHIFGKNTRDHALVKLQTKSLPGKPVRVSFDDWQVDACPHHGPAMDIAANGRYHMSWFNDGKERHGLFYAYTDTAGMQLSKPMRFGNEQAAAAYPSVISLGKSVYLVWQEYDGTQTIIQGMHSADAGLSWSAVKPLASTQAAADLPFLIKDGKRVYLTWHNEENGFQVFPLQKVSFASIP